ncbi:WYL domain-containing protein, partial [Streptomyces pilosus]
REPLVATALAVRAEETDADGRLRMHVEFQDARHAEWALWEHAPHAEVLAPQWLRASLHERATRVAARYGAPA